MAQGTESNRIRTPEDIRKDASLLDSESERQREMIAQLAELNVAINRGLLAFSLFAVNHVVGMYKSEGAPVPDDVMEVLREAGLA